MKLEENEIKVRQNRRIVSRKVKSESYGGEKFEEFDVKRESYKRRLVDCSIVRVKGKASFGKSEG
jgi:hypothetical protein